MTDLPIQCACGSVRGTLCEVSPDTVQHYVCHCDDCRAFIRHIDRAGDLLTEHGGTAVIHSTPARYTLTEGRDQLAAVRLSPKGLLRFYASCCNTPLGSVLEKPGIPLVSIARVALPADASAHIGASRGVNARFAIGDRSTLDAAERLPLSVLPATLCRLMLQKLQGQAYPSTFHEADGRPILEPTVLSAGQRAALQD